MSGMSESKPALRPSREPTDEFVTASQPRPFRDLCPEADARDAMDDGEFWEHVAHNLGATTDEPDDMPPDVETTNQTTPCPLCGEQGACSWDAEGRPLIHTLTGDDE